MHVNFGVLIRDIAWVRGKINLKYTLYIFCGIPPTSDTRQIFLLGKEIYCWDRSSIFTLTLCLTLSPSLTSTLVKATVGGLL